MNEIDSTHYGLTKLRTNISDLIKKFDETTKSFIEKFNKDDVSNSSDEVSLELKETFFRLIETKELLLIADNLMEISQKSLKFVKDKDSNIVSTTFVKRSNVHDFLADHCEDKNDLKIFWNKEALYEWSMIFKVKASFGNQISYEVSYEGNIYYEKSIANVSMTYYNKPDYMNINLFPENCWEEENVVMLKDPNGNIIKVVD